MLTGIQKLGLMQQLPQLMKEQATAPAMDRLKIGLQISQIMAQLGYSSKAAPAAAEPAPAAVPPAEPAQPTQPADKPATGEPDASSEVEKPETPQIVTDFLAGKFLNASPSDLVAALKGIAQYVGQFLTLDQAKDECSQWFTAGGYSM